MKSLKSRAFGYGFVVVLGLVSALPNLLPQSVLNQLPAWYAGNTLALGLDLRGGSHLLLEVDTADLLITRNQQLVDQIGDQLRESRLRYSVVEVSDDIVRLAPRDSRQVEALESAAREAVRSPDGAVSYSVSQRRGEIVLRPGEEFTEALISDAVERSLEVVRRRLDESGLVDPSITRQGSDGILVQLPGLDNPQEVRRLLGTTARMAFHWVVRSTAAGQATISVPGEQGEAYQLERRVALEGMHIADAQLSFNPETREPVVNFSLDNEGARQFADMTRDNIGRPLAIVLDGRVITAPVIRNVIAGGSGEISGSFSSTEASDLALLLRAGALPAPLQVIEERTVGPDLGSDSIAMGVTTGLAGAALVIAFMLGIYGRWGLIACAGLVVNIGLVFGVLSLFGATLTLPGIAGIILTVGMAVDANILINERIVEETRRNSSAQKALRQGFDRAFATILDSNVTTLIAVSLLYLVGNGPVRGFALTIGIGLVTSLFTSTAITRLLMEWRVRGMGRRPLHISGIRIVERFSTRRIDFMRARFAGLALSAVLSVASVALFFAPGLHYGIDFTGGTVIEVEAADTSVQDLRQALQQRELEQAAIQEFADEGRFLVRLPMPGEADGAEQVATGTPVQELRQAVLQVAPDAGFPRVEMVGPKVSGGFADATLLAILLAGSGMLVYLWVRFEVHFAIAATLTIVLDLTKTLGFFALTGIEFNLTAVAALLALIGYSINDKVVVFDRVRENLRLTPDAPLLPLLNDSIASTLTRTVFTSVTTFLALLPMAIAGGSAVASFALPMLFGIVIGTSSSIFIAAPIVLALGQRRLRRGLSQLRPTAEEVRRELEDIP